MRVTNKFNFPEPLVKALSRDTYKKVGHISTTELLKPPRILALEMRHQDEIEEDVSDRIYRALGSSFHGLMEDAASPNEFSEERLVIDVLGWKVSGKPDLYDKWETLWDYKICSVWAYILGVRKEYYDQLRIYSYLYAQHGFMPKKLANMLLFRDWSKSESERTSNYPPPAKVIEYEVPDPAETWQFIKGRVLVHQLSRSLPDDKLAPCTAEEKWERPTTWAVKKKGAKRAMPGGVCDSRGKAEITMAANPGTEIEERRGKCVRCADGYCKVAKWCDFGRSLMDPPLGR